MLNDRRVTVLGAGVAGLTVARALALKGAHVTVLEQAPEIREVGAGLQISPNGARVLSALGLGAALDGIGIPAERVDLIDGEGGGRVVSLDLRYGGQGGHFRFVHRADLISILAEAARAAGVEIRLLQQVADVTLGQGVPQLRMANGAEVEADILIGADGLHSKVRQALNGQVTPFFTGQVAWRAVVPNSAGRGPEAWVHMGPGRHVVSYPLRGGEKLNLVAVQERRGWIDEGWSRRDDPKTLRAAFADFEPRVQAMLAEVEMLHLWGLFRHEVAPRWHGRAVALLGDAAHPTLPFMAQGAAMALEDAWVLAASLSGAENVAVGLALYQQRREKRAARVINTATDNAWKYHLKFPPLRFAAHTVLRTGSRLFPDRMMGQFDWLYGHDVTRGD